VVFSHLQGDPEVVREIVRDQRTDNADQHDRVPRFQYKAGGRASRMTRIWNKYGIPGLGVLSPLITGSPLGAAIGISFGADPRKLIIWMTIGIVFWSAILTTAAALGVNAFNFSQ
jgi:hypothetical protein